MTNILLLLLHHGNVYGTGVVMYPPGGQVNYSGQSASQSNLVLSTTTLLLNDTVS